MAFGSGCAHILVDHTVLQVHIVHRQADHGAVLTQAQLGTQGQQGQGWKPEGQTTLRLALRPGSETATLSRLWWGHTNKHMVASPARWSTNPPTLPSADPSATFPVETDPHLPTLVPQTAGNCHLDPHCIHRRKETFSISSGLQVARAM